MAEDVDAASMDPMSKEVQIHCAVMEGMKNIGRAIFGNGLLLKVEYTLSSKEGTYAFARCSTSLPDGEVVWALAILPISEPDSEHGNYRISDIAFPVEVHGWSDNAKFEAWCENNPSLAAKVIVRCQSPDLPDAWFIADSMEDEVVFQGRLTDLPDWARQVVKVKWQI